jgi:hypothetical protein
MTSAMDTYVSTNAVLPNKAYFLSVKGGFAWQALMTGSSDMSMVRVVQNTPFWRAPLPLCKSPAYQVQVVGVVRITPPPPQCLALGQRSNGEHTPERRPTIETPNGGITGRLKLKIGSNK